VPQIVDVRSAGGRSPLAELVFGDGDRLRLHPRRLGDLGLRPGAELTDDDMADLPLPTLRSIEVLYFAPETDIDPILLARSYFVEPENSGARAYVLLRDAMERSGKVAVVQVALRQRESLAAMRSRDGVLVLETLLWPDEVRVPDFGFLDQDINVRTQELKMAASLIDSMSQDFDPEAHHDGYREALTELVEAKVEGRDVIQPQNGKAADDEPVSLADALKASIAAAKDGRSGRPRAGGPRKAATPAKTGRTTKPAAAKAAADDEEQAAPDRRRTRRRASA